MPPGAVDGATAARASLFEMAASCSFGIWMYCRKAELCHLPRVWIVESSMPARAAEVAAPMRKLCPAYSSCGRPREERTARTCCTNHDFVTGDPCVVMKKGPARSWRSYMYDTTAVTGQMGVSVRPTITSTPLPNWSHFDRFKWTFTIEGYVLLSTATSPHERCPARSYWSGASTRSSPSRKNPKKARLATAHISCLSVREEAIREP